ncbi:MAG: hypothetical protein NTV23_08190 [Propionibacteriales bacterium]|nr:hypothetical protein [Propionibacteriales bacterium]
MRQLQEWLDQYGPLTPYAAVDLVLQLAVELQRSAAADRGHGGISPDLVQVADVDGGLRAKLLAPDPESGTVATRAGDIVALGNLLTCAEAGSAVLDRLVARSRSEDPAVGYPDLGSMVADLRSALVTIAAGVTQETSVGQAAQVRSGEEPTEPGERSPRAAPALPPRSSYRRAAVLISVLVVLVAVALVVLLAG